MDSRCEVSFLRGHISSVSECGLAVYFYAYERKLISHMNINAQSETSPTAGI